MKTTDPIHLYRALLREATYLPLPSCRTFIKDYIRLSFERYHPRHDRHLPIHQSHKGNRVLTLQRETALLHRGRKFLSNLCRANQGNIRPLEKIIRMTYGRTGRRKYELLDRFVSPIPLPSTAKGLPPEERAPEPRQAKVSPHWKPPTHVEGLLASQQNQQVVIPRASAPALKRVKTPFSLTPAKNIWGKPLATKRKMNKLHEWYLDNTRAILPPLPEQEYKELLSIVKGETEIPAIPARRPMATSTASDTASLDSLAIRESSSILLSGPQPGFRFKDILNGRPHKVTVRFLRRRLARSVLQQTPLAEEAQKSKRGIAFRWDNGEPREGVCRDEQPRTKNELQRDLLFG